QKVYEEFIRLNAPIYACFGNHEYFADKQKALQFYKQSGINILQDTSVVYKNLVITGRDDRSNPSRKPLKELLKNTDKNKYHILLDHQPYNLEQAQENSIDFQFSGHTHYGQVFPINLITNAIYEKAYGSYKKGNTSYYISSGLGIWGGKFRIGTQSEYIVLNLKQK
ncbi:MAG: metallophosphoesterase, partial [Bacteroidota bacterium]|nr:metallophosphoesterase [Bacteroidota bacterium]